MAGKATEIRLYYSAVTLDDDPDSSNRGVYFDVLQLATTAVVPIAPAFWLFGSALGALGWMRRKAAA
ncbi:MAG: hypothetical protein OEV14_06280 [Gammaproteobacteria bacterium]|nr:hypothetical protein [Gammaproteobacteria bacterium]